MTPTAAQLREIFAASIATKQPSTQAIYLRSLEHLQHWANTQRLHLTTIQQPHLERFFAEEAREYSRATLQLRLSALRVFYRALGRAGICENDPTQQLPSIDIAKSTRPATYLDHDALLQAREHAAKIGPVHSLTICLLHETPISIARLAALSVEDFAADPSGRTFAILGRTQTSRIPWRVSEQIVDAITALRTEHPRLISPLTKNPNLTLVRDAIEEVRVQAGIQTSNLATTLKDTHRRKEQELCNRMRLTREGFAHYQRELLQELAPLGP